MRALAIGGLWLYGAANVLAYRRSVNGQDVVVALNVGDSRQQVSIPAGTLDAPTVGIGSATDIVVRDGRVEFGLDP